MASSLLLQLHMRVDEILAKVKHSLQRELANYDCSFASPGKIGMVISGALVVIATALLFAPGGGHRAQVQVIEIAAPQAVVAASPNVLVMPAEVIER